MSRPEYARLPHLGRRASPADRRANARVLRHFSMNILVVGGGAREHAFCWKLAQEPGVKVVCAPGNPGIAEAARVYATPVEHIDALLDLACQERVDLTVVGPEMPLALGLVDRFTGEGRRVLGPTRA